MADKKKKRYARRFYAWRSDGAFVIVPTFGPIIRYGQIIILFAWGVWRLSIVLKRRKYGGYVVIDDFMLDDVEENA